MCVYVSVCGGALNSLPFTHTQNMAREARHTVRASLKWKRTWREGGRGGDTAIQREDRRDAGLLVHLSVTSCLGMEIPLEQQQVLTLTLTMHTNMPFRRCPQSRSDDRCACACVCVTTVPELPRPVLFRVLTVVKFAQAAGPLNSPPARHHLTGVFTSRCQKRCYAPCVRLSVYTFASMILVFATSRGVVTNAATAPTKRHIHTLSVCVSASLKGPLSALRRVFKY